MYLKDDLVAIGDLITIYCTTTDVHLRNICISTDDYTQGLSWVGALYAALFNLKHVDTYYTGYVAFMNSSSLMAM